MDTYAYLRVSSKTQNIDRQLDAIINLGVKKKNIYIDICSGANFHRDQYKKLIKKLHNGDTLVIKSIDRLGRNYDEILSQWRLLSEREIFIRVLDMPILDISADDSPLIKTFISDIILQVLSFVAENELNNIHLRQSEGIAAAKAKGVKFGRPSLQIPDDFNKTLELYLNKELSSRQAANELNVSQTTFLKWAKDHCDLKNQ